MGTCMTISRDGIWRWLHHWEIYPSYPINIIYNFKGRGAVSSVMSQAAFDM